MGNYSDSIRFVIANQIDCGSHYANLTINGSGAFDEQGEENPLNFNIEIKAPFISDFTPKKATWEQTVTLYGKFHPVQSYSKVYFDNTIAPITSYSSDSIKVTVPTTLLSPNATGNIPITYKANETEVNANQDFLLEGPVISSFSPEKGSSYEKVVINGFYNSQHTKIYLGDVMLTPNSISNTSITVFIPSNQILPDNKYRFRAVVGSNFSESQKEFTVANPKVTNIRPTEACYSDTIIIYGQNFKPIKEDNEVWFMSNKAQIIEASEDSLKVIVPIPASMELNIKVGVKTNNPNHIFAFTYSPDKFKYYTSKILSVISQNNKIKIFGEFFHPSINLNTLYLRSKDGIITWLKVLNVSKNEIEAELPFLYRDTYRLFLRILGNDIESQQTFFSQNPWKILPSAPTSIDNWQPFSFVYENNGYIYFHNINKAHFNVFDPKTQLWKSISAPDNDFTAVTKFYNNGRLYFVGGVNREDMQNGIINITCNVQSFNPQNNNWETLKPFPGSPRSNSTAFTIGSKSYMYGGYDKSGSLLPHFWEYDTANDLWIRKQDIPFYSSFGLPCFTNDDKAYIVDIYGDVWEFCQATDLWIKKNKAPFEYRLYSIYFSINNKFLLFGGYNGSNGEPYNDSFIFDPSTDKWEKQKFSPIDWQILGVGFSINGIGYFGYGIKDGYYKYDFYEYDPTLEPTSK
jgi:hypothetical protein